MDYRGGGGPGYRSVGWAGGRIRLGLVRGTEALDLRRGGVGVIDPGGDESRNSWGRSMRRNGPRYD